MKQANVFSTIILVAAVLVAAYAVGLLIRQARMETPALEQVAGEPNDPNGPEAVGAGRRIGQRREPPTEEERAKAQEERAEKLAEVSDLTDEEKQQRLEAMREQFRSGRSSQGGVTRLSPDEQAKLKDMTEEEQRAFRARLQARRRARPSQPPVPAEAGTSPAETPASDPNSVAGPSDPNGTSQD